MRFSVAALLTCALALPSQAATTASQEWPSYNHDAGATRFSPLTQINAGNVGQLTQAWVYHMKPPGGVDGNNRLVKSEAAPLVVGGVMYVDTPYDRIVALDSSTGREIWAYELPNDDAPATRGLEYWPGGNSVDPRLVFGTRMGRLMEISVKTGKPAADFGVNGVVDLKTPDVMNGAPDAQYTFSSPPLMVGDLIIAGSRVQERPAQGASGDVRAFDARTGKLVWIFHTVPRPGELGHDTWEGDSWKNRSGTNVWNYLLADTQRGIVYLPIGAPTYDGYGGDRHGTNLFGNSIVALNAKTGKYLWHFQTVHHDIWDVDLPSATLIEVKRNGKTIPGIAVMNKTSVLFMLDRVTGKPLYDVKEVPVPTDSDVPNEQPWPTQPQSVTPPLARTTYNASELTTVTPELHDFCAKLVKDLNIVPSKMFQPPRMDSTVASFPGWAGGIDWGGAAFDPRTGYYIANSNSLAAIEPIVKKPDGSLERKSVDLFWNPKTRQPCQQPPWGNLSAVDVNTGKIAWEIPLGVSPDLPPGQQNTGRFNIGGPITTAGGLIFIGATDEGLFRAFDTKTGKELWKSKLAAPANDIPITYSGKDGRQYVAVISTGGGLGGIPTTSDTIEVFALPRMNGAGQ
jgi:quinoprotein glucose dehydrogenase